MPKIKIINASDWEALYVDGILKQEGHTLNQGERREIYINREVCKQYNVTIDEIEFGHLTDEGEEWLSQIGRFPKELSAFESFIEIEMY